MQQLPSSRQSRRSSPAWARQEADAAPPGPGRAPVRRRARAFTLVELLTVVAVVGVLAALLLPALQRARRLAQRTACLNQLRQQGMAWRMYLDENDSRFPDRRDLKTLLPGGYRPWADWPPSDPRAGWAAVVLAGAGLKGGVWDCPSARAGSLAGRPQVWQAGGLQESAPVVRYWMWRFDRVDEPVPLDNFWGRRESDCVVALRAAGNPNVGQPTGPAEVELVVDVYFPATSPTVPAEWRGRSAHPGGRNRLMMDGHARFWRDPRLGGS
jgi:prepilin-type N-terminal cleavage/methylation domain-containing protein/prepilin-type processing-associated H-X9-DG protein